MVKKTYIHVVLRKKEVTYAGKNGKTLFPGGTERDIVACFNEREDADKFVDDKRLEIESRIDNGESLVDGYFDFEVQDWRIVY